MTMPRSIVAAALYRPAWEAGGRVVEGPDEDALTMAVAATEALPLDGRSLAVSQVHWVGEAPPETAWAFPEALGLPHLTVPRHAGEPGAVGRALVAASLHPPGPGDVLVVVPEPSGPPEGPGGTGASRWSAAAAAFLLSEAPGLLPNAHGGRRHPLPMPPEAAAWVEALRAGTGLAPEQTGRLLVRSRRPPPVLLATVQKELPRLAVEASPEGGGGTAPGPLIAEAASLFDVARNAEPGSFVAVARVEAEATTFAGFEVTGPVRWVGDWAAAPGAARRARSAPSARADPRAALSEGAYVPRPRYLESLGSRFGLLASRCGACGEIMFPQRRACRKCGRSDALAAQALPRQGRVEAVTTVGPGAQPTEFDPLVEAIGPYDVAIVGFSPGVRVTLQVADRAPGALRVGDPVTTVFRRLYPMEGEWRYGRKALALPPAAGPA